MSGFLKLLLLWLTTKQRMLWQQVPQVPGRGLGCPCAWWMQTSPRLVLLGVTARSQPSALASPKCFTEGRDVPDLASLSQRHILVTHGVVFSALSHLPLCPHSVPKGRATLSQVVLSSVPNLCSQRPLPEHPQQRDMSPCPPTPKNEAAVPGLFREIWGWGCLLRRCHEPQELLPWAR